MEERRGRVAVLAVPGDLPDGWDAVCRRAAERSEVAVEVVAVDTAAELRAALAAAEESADAVVLHAGRLADDASVAEVVATLAVPAVHVDVAPVDGPADGTVRAAGERTIHGRGRSGFAWALRYVVARTAGPPPRTVTYGEHPEQVIDLRVPDGAGPHRLCVLLHGGFWLHAWERDTMEGVAVDLTRRGWATANVGYRRLGPTGGGWPATFADVTAALDRIGMLGPEDRLTDDERVLLGHSAGATLALWGAATSHLASAVVSLAGVLDLADAAARDLGAGAVRGLLATAGPGEDVARIASPERHLPVGLPLLVVHGRDDEVVPPVTSGAFVDAARAAGDTAELHEVDGGHFDLVQPESAAWSSVADLLELIPPRR